jgi:hypothetical protein
MAHFAKIGLNNIVTEVLVVANRETMDAQGVEHESIGVEFLKTLTGHETWIQTSYNGNIRKNYAGIGYTYDSQRDAFIPTTTIPKLDIGRRNLQLDCPCSLCPQMKKI